MAWEEFAGALIRRGALDCMGLGDTKIRRMEEGDLDAVGTILASSAEAAQWQAADCLDYVSFLAEREERVVGVLTARALAPGETEILNLAVDPAHRRTGVARALIGHFFLFLPGSCFLEVRESNEEAIQLYESIGFIRISRRHDYYSSPNEDAIVMRLSA